MHLLDPQIARILLNSIPIYGDLVKMELMRISAREEHPLANCRRIISAPGCVRETRCRVAYLKDTALISSMVSMKLPKGASP